MKLKLPSKKELKGLRFGQAIWNSLFNEESFELMGSKYNFHFADRVYFIENSELEKLLSDYFKRLGK